MAVKEESGVFLVWSSSTRARQSRNRRNFNHSATIEVQEAPGGTRTGLTSLQGALAVLLVAGQLVAFVQHTEEEANQHQQQEHDQQEQQQKRQQ